MVCPNCGNDLNEGEDVCAFCHYNVKVSSTVVEKEPDEIILCLKINKIK